MESIRHIRQALKLVWVSSKSYTLALIVAQLIRTFLPISMLFLIKLIIDSVTTNQTDSFSDTIKYLIAFGIILLLKSIIDNIVTLLNETQQRSVADHMASVVIKKATEVDLAYYENPDYYDTFHIAQRQAATRPLQVLNNVNDLVQNTLMLLALSGLLIMLHWSLLIVMFGFSLPAAAVKYYYSKKLHTWEVARTKTERESVYLNTILTSEPYAKEIKLFNLGPILLTKFLQIRKTLFDEVFNIGKARTKSGIIAQLSEAIAITLSFAYIAWNTFKKIITIGDMVMYFQAFQQGQQAIQKVYNSMVGLYNNRLFLQHIFELLEYRPIVTEPAEPKQIEEATKRIEFKDVSFSYPKTQRKALSNVNLDIESSQITAIVGKNGSGKTTLIKLLSRLYDPTDGNIFLNDTNLKDISQSSLREKINIIFQDFSKYQFGVSDNIRISRLSETEDIAETKKAANLSGADDFINTLPRTYSQRLGRWFKNGAELSGGQWQKIALARAFYKCQDIIILDEPTGAIDPVSEYDIFNNLKIIAKNKIVILITHRLYNLKGADKIIVLNDGKVAEVGTHESLMNNKDIYYDMFQTQN